MTRRQTKTQPWGEPVNLGPLINASGGQYYPCISHDSSTLYFTNIPGYYGRGDILQAQIIPIVDFNGDRKVDIADLQIMVDHWGENYSLCDIGPTPFGDGIVDGKDLVVITEHFSEDYRFVAHWKLDETDGDIDYDSIGDHDGTLYGNPFWQSTYGMIGGALLFDGIDDYVSTPLYPGSGERIVKCVCLDLWLDAGTSDHISEEYYWRSWYSWKHMAWYNSLRG